MGLEELVCGHEPRCRRGGLAVQPAVQGLAMAREPSLVSQLRQAETLAAQAGQAKAAAQVKGDGTREDVWRDF
jgi:hypothetical protein